MNIVAAPGRPDLKLGVRPEHIHLADAGGVAAIVQGAEYLGADTVVTCTTSAPGTVGESLAARLPGRHDLAEGTGVRLAWRRADTHRFDAVTGLRRDDLVAVPA